MPIPVEVGDYVTPAMVRAELKLGAGQAIDDRLERVCSLASWIVFAFVGQAGADVWLQPPVDPATYPAAAVESALAIAIDLWRRPTAPAGYVQVADYVGRLAQDPTSPVASQLSLMRLSWPIS